MNKEEVEPWEGGTELKINLAIYRQIFIRAGNKKCLNFLLRRENKLYNYILYYCESDV